MKHEFAVKKNTLHSGRVIFTPVYRTASRMNTIMRTPWTRIIKIYDRFQLQDVDFEPNLTFDECEQHIAGYKAELEKLVEQKVTVTEFLKLEEK